MEFLQFDSENNDSSCTLTASPFEAAARTAHTRRGPTVRSWSLFTNHGPHQNHNGTTHETTLPLSTSYRHHSTPATQTMEFISRDDESTSRSDDAWECHAWAPSLPTRSWMDSAIVPTTPVDQDAFHCAFSSDELAAPLMASSPPQAHSERYDRQRATLVVILVLLAMLVAYLWAYYKVASVDNED